MKREISKRIELSKGEAKVLQMKAKQCGLNETDLIRELIMGLQPTEAPPRQFYEKMEIMSQLGEAIQQFLMTWTGVATPEMVQILQGMCGQLSEACVEIKNSVTKARFYSPDVYEIWEYEVHKAAKEGNTPPTLDEVRERYTRRAIMNPATDFDLGWNALGVQPPFLGEGKANPDDSPVVSPGEAPAAYSGDSPTVCPPPYPNVSTFTEQDVAVDRGYERASDSGQWRMADEEGSPGVLETQAGYTQEGSDSISIEDYAATNIFSPPRKEGDY
jgi:hypothetical protein